VQAIRAVHYELSPPVTMGTREVVHPRAGSARILPVPSADGRDEIDGLHFAGYLVDLGEVRESNDSGPCPPRPGEQRPAGVVRSS
jgi:hypothetical protein